MTSLPYFYLGAPEPVWLSRTEVPLFVSHRRLARCVRLPRSPRNGHWALDSGGFSELSTFGEWRTTPEEYVRAAVRYDSEIGNLGWAAPQDWMCEPFMVDKTGLSVAEHQHRTVANLVRLRELWAEAGQLGDNPFMPVLQGWQVDDYHRCWDLYEQAGVRISEHYPVVALGSVCRRQATEEIGAIVASLRERDPELPIHGFGVKAAGLTRYGHLLTSADSMAWSFTARHSAKDPTCTGTHRNCANCLTYALSWRERLLSSRPPTDPTQGDLFESLSAEGRAT